MRSLLFTLLFCVISNETFANDCNRSIFDLAFTTGYIWKNDHQFKKVYGAGIQDIITVDGCYWFFDPFGVGLKGSYWAANGKTTILKRPTHVQEVPLIAYFRGRVGSTFQLYVSLGIGEIFVKETSYLGKVNKNAFAVEAEVGVNYYFFKHLFLTSAFRYLHSQKEIPEMHEDADFGGYGIRGGVGVNF